VPIARKRASTHEREMADPKDTTSFFRKVVKFVANPSTDWAALGSPTDEERETEFAKGELKAMIERKRRNDFVRKREFDLLRKVRREGLTSDQFAALGGSSRLDDPEVKNPDSGHRADTGVKAKIDEIELQMAGESLPPTLRRPPAPSLTGVRRPPSTQTHEFRDAPTDQLPLDDAVNPLNLARAATGERSGVGAETTLAHDLTDLRPAALPAHLSKPVADKPGLASGFAPAPALSVDAGEVAHDPDLDEAVIAFANADFEQCEQVLTALTAPDGTRARHAETWLVLFDLYRAIGQQHKFESRALDYAQQFSRSAPQWFSMPKLVADAASDERPQATHLEGHIGWICPEHLEPDAVARLSALAMQMPLPWVFDWSALRSIDAEACARLSEVFRHWITQKLDMRWLGGDQLFQVLQDMSPAGVRDVDPVFWQLRLDALRMANRADQFDETAIDYCVTYEVSPPSWEPARCQVRISGSGSGSTAPSISLASEVSTNFPESHLSDDSAVGQVGNVELSGQLVGDIGETLRKMDHQLGNAAIINVSCARLIRVDFIAAGDLLNWVLARRGENRTVNLIETHRMVALFFGAMGINEHARVKVRTV